MSSVTVSDAQSYLSRQSSLVSPRLREASAVVVGIGAGSYMAEKLARAGVGLSLVDHDVVEWSNLGRSTYTVDDVGLAKVEALARRVRVANPFVEVTPVRADLCALNDDEAAALVGSAQLLVAGTDNFQAQASVNTLSLRHGIPAVFVGIHERGEGGRIVWSVPGHTPCYRCVSGHRYRAFASGGTAVTDLAGEPAMLVDCQFVDMIALKVVLAVLERAEDSALGRFYRRMVGRNEIIVRTSPDFPFGAQLWEALLGDLPTAPKDYAAELSGYLLAMDSLWLPTVVDPSCPDCQPRDG